MLHFVAVPSVAFGPCSCLVSAACASVMNWAISNLTGGNRVSRAILVRYSSVPLAEDGGTSTPAAASTPARSSISHTSLSSTFAATFLHSSSRHNHNNNNQSSAASTSNNNNNVGTVGGAGAGAGAAAAASGSNATPSLTLPLDVEETVTCFCR